MLHTCCFSLVNNPVLSSFLLMEPSALEPSTVIMNGFTVIFFFFGYFFERAMHFFCALYFSYIEMRCLIHSSVYSNAIFLTLSDLEILSVNCFACFVSTEYFDGSVSTECFFLFFSFWETSLAMFALSFLVPCVT